MAGLTAWNRLRVPINTDEILRFLVTPVWSHQVSMILFGPTIRTVVLCGYHQLSATWPDIAHYTGSVVIVHISIKRIEGAHFKFGSVYGSSTFKMVSVFSVFGLVWQTEMVTSSSCIAVMAAGYEPWISNQTKTKTLSITLEQRTEVKHIPRAGLTQNCCWLWLGHLQKTNTLWTANMHKLFK